MVSSVAAVLHSPDSHAMTRPRRQILVGSLMFASDRPTGSDGFNCRNQEGIALDIQAVDLTTLVGTLDVGAPP